MLDKRNVGNNTRDTTFETSLFACRFKNINILLLIKTIKLSEQKMPGQKLAKHLIDNLTPKLIDYEFTILLRDVNQKLLTILNLNQIILFPTGVDWD